MASLGFKGEVQASATTTLLLDFSCQSVGTTTGAIPAANIAAGRVIKSMTGSYAATGVYTFTLPYGSAITTGYVFKASATARGSVVFHPQVDSITNSNGQLVIVVNCYDMAGVAVAPASTTGVIIDVSVVGSNNTGG